MPTFRYILLVSSSFVLWIYGPIGPAKIRPAECHETSASNYSSTLRNGPEEGRSQIHTFLISVLDGGDWSGSRPSPFPPGEGASAIESWKNPRVNPDAWEINIAQFVPAPAALLHRPCASQQRISIRENAAEVSLCHGQKGLSIFFSDESRKLASTRQ
jgi:hypothetical protein